MRGFVRVAVVLRRLRVAAIESSCILLITLALLLDIRARPELLATFESVVLFVTFATASEMSLMTSAGSVWLGVVFATLLVTQPTVFGLTLLGFAIYIVQSPTYVFSRTSVWEIARFASLTSVVFVCTFVALTYFCFGGSPLDWLKGIRSVTSLLAARRDFEGFVKYYAANRFLPGLGLGLVLLPALAWCAWESVSSLKSGRLVRRTILIAENPILQIVPS